MKIQNDARGNMNLHPDGKLISHEAIVRTIRDRNLAGLIAKRFV